MMRVIGYVILGLLAYAVFVIATLPASQAIALLQQRLPTMRAAGVTGTAWSGEAAVLQLGNQNLQHVDWQIKPWSVVLGELEVDVVLDDADLAGSASLGLKPDGAVHLSNVNLRLDAGRFSALARTPVTLGGQFDLQLDSAALKGQQLNAATGQVRWQRAAVTAPVTQPLGEFVAQLSTTKDGIKAQIKDDGGPLQLNGSALLTPQGAYTFNGSVAVRDPQQQMLVQGLHAMGRPGPDGRVPLRYSGRL
jgi:general secretion pathway protein N